MFSLTCIHSFLFAVSLCLINHVVTGAVGAVHAPIAAAELEGGDEPGLVSVDTPTAPSKAIEELLNQVL